MIESVERDRRLIASLRRAVVTIACVGLTGCYSFKGGSAPAHLETIAIPLVEDRSSFGLARVRLDLTDRLVQEFRDDNSLQVIDNPDADARLEVSITAIRTDQRLGVSDDDRETVRGVQVQASATLYDRVKDREIFTGFPVIGESSYDISTGAAGEDRALDAAVEQLAEQILLKVVADW